MYCTSMYAVHEYQTSKAAVIIESNFGYYDAFLILFSLPHPLLFVPPSLKPVLRAGVSRVLSVLPLGPSEARPLNIKSVLLCIIMFNG